MENADIFGSSTAPLTWHEFLERMRHPSAADFVKSIKSFIVSLSNNAPDPDKDSAAVQEFLAKMEGAFRAHSLWAGCSEEELESAGEGLEKYVMTKLYQRVFATFPEDINCDEKLSHKMALVQQFIRPENLDIQPAFENGSSWLLAQKELQKINMVKAPRDKLVCILNCCKVINNLLLNASMVSNEHPPGADEFLPVLIYVTIKANPPKLHSNLLYIQRYRCQSRLVSEAAYFFTNMLSAESFITNIDAKSISMDETDFEKNMESGRALLSGLSTDLDGESVPSEVDRAGHGYVSRTESMKSDPQMNSKNKRNSMSFLKEHLSQSSAKKSDGEPDVDQVLILKKPSIFDLEKSGSLEILKEEEVSRAFQGYPYLYSQAGDLTVDDVEDLLNSYKQLVFKYVCLSKGMSIASPSLSLPIPPTQTQTQTYAATEKESEGRTIEKEKTDTTTEKESEHRTVEKETINQVNEDDSLEKNSAQVADNFESVLPPDEAVTHRTQEEG